MSEHTESDGRLAGFGLRLADGGLRGGAAASGFAFTHPDQVVSDRALTWSEKREILASWASDTRTVADNPALRQLDSGAIVRVEEILGALKSLDRIEPFDRRGFEEIFGLRPSFPRRNRKVPGAPRSRRLRWDRSDDDDDPPPCPVSARSPKRGPPPCPASAAAAIDQPAMAGMP
ncbi:MAG: hypothetical protein K2X49_06920 [Acetobacteraceae bacterium]|nr:hypothetical protein [Acetobacteraceae bacterium]